MVKYILATFMVVFIMPLSIKAQSDTVNINDFTLDLLKTPTNATFLIMNTSPTEIVEPGSFPEFFISAQNASSNFSVLPNNYATSFTPFWWTKKAKLLDFDKDFDTINRFTFFRTMTISAGMVQGVESQTSLWRYGLGFNATLLRGKVDAKKKRDYMQELSKSHDVFISFRELKIHGDSSYMDIQNQINFLTFVIKRKSGEGSITADEVKAYKIEVKGELDSLLEKRKFIEDSISKLYKDSIFSIDVTNTLNTKMNDMLDRKGLKWDVGAGLSINSDDNKIDNTGLYRAGIWSTTGFNLTKSESKSELMLLFLVRYQYYNEQNYIADSVVYLIDNLHTMDLGFKLQYEYSTKFSVGIEAVYRSAIVESKYENTYKINGIMQYSIGKNRLIYTSIGNNFNDNSNYGPEDIVVTIGLNLGFGSPVNYSSKL